MKALLLTFAVWFVYRIFFTLPDWFDEVIVKALVFGFPAWWYAREKSMGKKKVRDPMGLSNVQMWQGMFFGLVLGGFYEFVAILAIRLRGDTAYPSLILMSPAFWKILLLAVITAWWESLFFFGFVQNRLSDLYKYEAMVVCLTALVFVVFHAPLRFMLVGNPAQLASQLIILAIFAIGQSILYFRTKSMYALTVSHALWGLIFYMYG